MQTDRKRLGYLELSGAAKGVIILALLVALFTFPLVSRKWITSSASEQSMDTLVLISPHAQSTVLEFKNGFEHWYKKKTGHSVKVDYRYVGGVNEIIKLVESLYENSFRRYWTHTLGRPWSNEVAAAFCLPMPLGEDPKNDTLAQSARRAFLNSNVGCGMDIAFGGSVHDFNNAAARGFFTPCTVFNRHPDWASDASLPLYLGSGQLRDPHNFWVGTTFTLFGIVYNADTLAHLGCTAVPKRWSDLTSPKLIGEIALCDPTKSGVIKQGFALIIQETMEECYQKLVKQGVSADKIKNVALDEGWIDGLRCVQLMAANARYFTEKSLKPVLDVACGNCAMGIANDFTGLAQVQTIENRGGKERLIYTTPSKGSAALADPTAIFKGAPNEPVAQLFIEYVLSIEGQKLWCYPVGSQGGPQQFAIRRLPIRKEFYTDPALIAGRIDSEENCYNVESQTYDQSWLSPILPVLQTIIKCAFMDPHAELKSAWSAIIDAQRRGDWDQANAAMRALQNFDGLSRADIAGQLGAQLRSNDPLVRIRAQSMLTERFIAQYKEAQRIARGYPPHAM